MSTKGRQPVLNKLYGTQIQQLKNLSKKEYKALKELCFLSKNLYNVGVYNVRQHYFTERTYLNYRANYPLCKDNENYGLLNSNMAQQILKEVDGCFQSFFGLLRLAKKGKYDYRSIKLPHYLPKNSYSTLVIGQIRIKENGILDIPMSPSFKRLYGKVTIKVPNNILDKTIKEIRIIPRQNARYFEIQYSYEIDKVEVNLNKNNALAIDVGIDNLATCVTNIGDSFIIDGKKLKSINQWTNKENSRLQSIKDKQKIKGMTNAQNKLWSKRNRIVKDYINKTAKIIIDYCLKNNIGNIIIGYNKTIQNKTNIGKTNNQNFVNIPIGLLKERLEQLCKIYNINFKEQEESYTSKSDFLANDILPILNTEKSINYVFKGKRISRGQYKSSTGVVLNADINGALNIMKKANIIDMSVLVNIKQPIRINVA